MQSNTTTSVNVIVWSHTLESAEKLAHTLIGHCTEVNGHSGTHDGVTVNVFLRAPGEIPSSHPQGTADALVVSVADEANYNSHAKSYVETRRNIPFKYIYSETNLSDVATSIEGTYVNTLFGLTASIVNNVRELDSKLLTAFQAIDLNGNGFLTSDELIAAAAKLEHNLSTEEAKLIATSLSNDGNIPFSGFKTWWIRGRGDFNSFRRMVKVEMQVGNILKQGSEVFNNFVKNLSQQDAENGYKGKLVVSPVQDFESGIGVSVEAVFGNDFDDMFKNFPENLRSSALQFTFEIQLSTEDQASLVKNTVDTLVALGQQIPPVQQALSSGLSIGTRNVGNTLLIDLSIGGQIGDMAVSQLSQFNFAGLNFNGNAFYSFFSGIRLSDLLSGNFSNLLERLALWKFESHGQLIGLKNLMYAVADLYENMRYSLPYQVRQLIPLVRLLAAVRNFDFEFRYDSNEVASAIKEFASFVIQEKLGGETPSEALEIASSQLSGFQAMAPAMIEQSRPMIDAVVGPFRDAILALNVDKFSVSYVIPTLRMFYKANLHLPGVTNFVSTNVLGGTQ